MTEATPEESTSAPPRRWLRRVLLAVVAVAAVSLAVVVLLSSSDELFAAGDTLTSLDWRWLMVAVAAEVLSYGLRGAAQAVVLRRGAAAVDKAAARRRRDAGEAQTGPGGTTKPGWLVLAAATWSGDAAAYCLPFGFAAFGVVAVRALRHRGVPAALATWTLAVAQVFYLGSVAVLTVVAVQVAGGQDPIPGLEQTTYGLLAALIALGVCYVVLRRSRMGAVLRRARAARLARRHRGGDGHRATSRRRHRAAARIVGWWQSQREQLRAVHLPPIAATGVFGLMLGSWLTDIAVLGISYAALGASPPWTGLLLAYCAAQIVSAVPVTPGGIGVVEGSLTLALVAFGGAETLTLAAVLLFRLITYWGCIPVGAMAWLGLRFARRADPDPGTAAVYTDERAAWDGGVS